MLMGVGARKRAGLTQDRRQVIAVKGPGAREPKHKTRRRGIKVEDSNRHAPSASHTHLECGGLIQTVPCPSRHFQCLPRASGVNDDTILLHTILLEREPQSQSCL